MYVSPREAAEHYKVTTNTIRTWADNGKIEFIKTSGGHRRYLIKDKIIQNTTRRQIIYCRVSSVKQKGDLERQVEFLRKKYPNHEVVKDIGSGINFKRTGFLQIMAGLFDGIIEEVIVAHSDRWSRIGFDLFEWIFSRFESRITSLDKGEQSPEEELSKDLMEIITVFSARYHGLRSYKNSEDRDTSDKESDEEA